MAFGSLTDAFSILANEETFIDKDLLYVAAGLLVILALTFSFLGMRREDFPSPSQLRIVVGLFAVLVLVTGFGAIQTARFEQAERRAENEEAAKEAGAEDVANQQSEDTAGAGEAGDAASGTGATPDSGTEATPQGETGGGSASGEPQSSTGGAVDVEAGRTLFTDTGCGGCHTLSDAQTTGEVGPNLDDAIPTLSAADVKTSIIDPSAKVAEGFPDGTMPSTYGEQLDDQQIQTLVDYLVSVTQKG